MRGFCCVFVYGGKPMTKTEYVSFRCTPYHVQIIKAIKRDYGLKSAGEAIRRGLEQINVERRLVEAQTVQRGEK